MKKHSSIYNTNVKERIQYYGELSLDKSLESIGGKNVTINGTVNSKVILNERYDSNGESYKVIGKPVDILRGNIIHHDNEDWIITSKPENNGIYHKAIMNFCNSQFPIKTEYIETLLVGKDGKPKLDKFGLEQYKTESVEIFTPCLVESSFNNVNDNIQLPLVQASIKITVPYDVNSNVDVNYKFEMYNTSYQIVNIDKTKIQNNTGVIIYICKVVTD